MTVSELQGFSAASVQELETLLRQIGTGKLAIVGVGNPLRADDFAGSLVVKQLARRLFGRRNQTLLLDAEIAPENLTDKIRAFAPETVIFIDSAVMGYPPGTIKLVDLQETEYPYFSTHNLPLRLLSSLMGDSPHAFLLGIEPRRTDFGEKMSREVKLACESVVDVVHRTVGVVS